MVLLMVSLPPLACLIVVRIIDAVIRFAASLKIHCQAWHLCGSFNNTSRSRRGVFL